MLSLLTYIVLHISLGSFGGRGETFVDEGVCGGGLAGGDGEGYNSPLRPDINYPAARQFITSLPQLYLRERTKVSNVLKEIEAVSLPTGIWTSRRTQSYNTLTAQALGAD